MGVAGSGKTTVGTLLAGALGSGFVDADTLHSAGNVAKMSRGVSLTDADRAPWLEAIHARIQAAFSSGEDLVVACSALKERYRQALAGNVPIRWVYLKGSPELIRARLLRRFDHFAKDNLLASQLDALEEPADAFVVDITPAPEVIVKRIVTWLARYP